MISRRASTLAKSLRYKPSGDLLATHRLTGLRLTGLRLAGACPVPRANTRKFVITACASCRGIRQTAPTRTAGRRPSTHIRQMCCSDTRNSRASSAIVR